MMGSSILLIFITSLTGYAIGELRFTVEPTNVTVEEGMKTTLPCVATGASIIVYVWFNNLMDPIPLSDNSSETRYLSDGNLTFNEVTEEDEDEYSCMAIDLNNPNINITSEPVYLTVTLAPAITSLTISSSNNFTVRSDTTKLFFVHNDTKLMLNCVAEGDTDEIMYSWYKDDTILNNDRVSVLDNGSLLINATDYRHDDGEYYCEAIDRYGDNVTSDSVELSIAYLEKDFIQTPQNVTTSIGTKVKIYCTPPEGNPPATLSWIHMLGNAMTPVEENDRVKIRKDWLVINNTEIADSGFYQCVANNGYFKRTHSAYLNVGFPNCPSLQFEEKTRPLYALPGKPVYLPCITPPLSGVTYTWKSNGQKVSGNSSTFPNGTLVIYSYNHTADKGGYDCFVSRQCNPDDPLTAAHISLDVARINNFRPVEPKIVGIGTSFKLSCDLPDAKPEPDLTWMFNGATIETGRTYEVLSASLSDTGVYTCRAENIAGSKELLIDVTILGRPFVTINNASVQLGSTAVLTCSSLSPYVTNISWSYNGKKLESEGNKVNVSDANGNSTLTITDVDEDDFGVYNCTIRDRIHLTYNEFTFINHTNLMYFTHDNSSKESEAEVGETAQFVCSVAGAIDVIFTWYEDRRILENGSKYIISYSKSGLIHTSQLNLMTVGGGANYTYRCFAADAVDIRRSINESFILCTTLQPYFRIRPQNVTKVALGGQVTVHCIIDGRPRPQVTWTYHDLTEVTNDTSRLLSFPNGTLIINGVVEEDYGEYWCHADSNLDVNHRIVLEQASTGDQNDSKKIAGLAENVFLVVIGVVIVVIIYTAIMCLMLFLCCYCRKEDNKPPPYRQERNLYTPDPVPVKEERVSSSLSRASNGVKDIPGVTYYDLPHPFSRASSDARSHDTMELVRMADNEATNNTASRSSEVTETFGNHDNQFRSSYSPTFPRTNLQFTNKLGDGEFGPVYQGIAKEMLPGEPDTLVAIKMLLHPRDGDEESSSTVQDLDNFRAQMKLQYTNIASILAMCTDVRPHYIIYEYLDCGDLKKFLRNSSPDADQPPKLTQHSLLQIILQVADGMSYLSSNKIIHGDLAARNCIISSELRVKVADLGIGHDVYNDDYYDDGAQLLPIRWMPPEILRTAEFSIYSDMWSFGVLCWEVFSFGRQPYEMVSNEELLTLIPSGVQLQIPEEGCPNPLYAIMQDCWHMQPDKRPKFAHLCVAIIDLDLD